MKPRVAIASCRRAPGADASDLYPDPDAGPLCAAFAADGVEAIPLAWDDPGVHWEEFSHVLVSSTWDSVERPEEYLGWAGAVSAPTVLVNDRTTLERGLRGPLAMQEGVDRGAVEHLVEEVVHVAEQSGPAIDHPAHRAS